ncbi:MAG: C69 family dipeptidase [Bacteroidales bacterium]|nr:C69 family dipeptidase [Bacteroidales bacterium]
MKRKSILAGFLFTAAMTLSVMSFACTNFLFTKGATKDGSTMITYAADSHTLYGELYYTRAAMYPAGTMIQVIEWDTGKPLIKIPQAAQTYTTVGNMNEWGLTIGETTYGGREECWHQETGIDYGSLIYLTLQRTKTAREAIKQIADFMNEYGYVSEGESFSIADGDEVWIMELIGKGKGEKGAVWVARMIPDGYVSGHANQARITQFPLEQKKNTTSVSYKNINKIFDKNITTAYSDDVITFARKKGWFNGKDAEFSFSDTYAPLTFSGVRGCEARVYAMFNRVNSNMKKYEDYVMGKTLGNANIERMPLWIKPDSKVSVKDVMELMRDYYQGTAMDMSQDLGAGPFKCPYRWRPMTWEVDGQAYVHERATSTQQTGFSFVAQTRSWMPSKAKGILWFGVDDTYTTVYTPMFGSIEKVPHCFEVGNGSMTQYSPTSAFWKFNQVSNWVYTRWIDMIKDLQKVQNDLENSYINEVAQLDAKIKNMDDVAAMCDTLTAFSVAKGNQTFDAWSDLYNYLLVKYIDGNIKKEKDGKFQETGYRKGDCVFPDQPAYPDEWYRMIIKDHGDVIKDLSPKTK